jgi:hypothetical protein
MLAALTSLRVETLVEQDRRVSAALTRDIRSPAAHEDAALLIGALVLREAAGRFDDVRAELSQMTAQLAIARALRGDKVDRVPGRVTGALAEMVLLVSLGRQRDAVDRLDRLNAAIGTAGAPAVRAWTHALRLRATGDWRTQGRLLRKCVDRGYRGR